MADWVFEDNYVYNLVFHCTPFPIIFHCFTSTDSSIRSTNLFSKLLLLFSVKLKSIMYCNFILTNFKTMFRLYCNRSIDLQFKSMAWFFHFFIVSKWWWLYFKTCHSGETYSRYLGIVEKLCLTTMCNTFTAVKNYNSYLVSHFRLTGKMIKKYFAVAFPY